MRTPRLLFCVLVPLSAFLSCGGVSGPTPDEVAAHAAKVYYEQLLKGDYEGFVDGHWQPDSVPEDYREQLVANARMFIGQQEKEHEGIRAVSIANAKADTTHRTASVFLTLKYGDKTTEQVLVPMVLRRGVWYLR